MISFVVFFIAIIGTALLTQRSPRLSPIIDSSASTQKISVIIPARNEERQIGELLTALSQQTLKPYEIIVVDDRSTDQTAEIARQHGTHVLAAPDPVDSLPKTSACHYGFVQSHGEIVIFLDADVCVSPNFVATVADESSFRNACVTFQPHHECKRLIDYMSLFFHFLSITGSGLLSRIPFRVGVFGPCLAMPREIYVQTGGYNNEKVKNSVIEDVQLGEVLQQHNYDVRRYLGKDLITYRMYNDTKSFIQGWRKNISRGSSHVPILVMATLVIYIGSLIALPINAVIARDMQEVNFILWLTGVYILLNASMRIGNYGRAVAIYPVALLVFFFVFSLSLFDKVLRRNVIWKSRTLKSST